MISIDAFADTFGAVPAGDTERLVKVAVLAVRNGFAVVLDHPGKKVPLCTLTAAAAKKENREAQESAKQAGDPNWDRRKHACGLKHAITDPAAAARIIRRLTKNGVTPNLGVEVGLSRMVVVDVDTAAERDAFLTAWTSAEGRDMTSMVPTVKSPGAKNDHGKWVHKDGGHFWFTVPAGTELPEGGGVLKGTGGWAVLWRGKQVLVPPSSREEGEYRLVGQAMQLPDWLKEFIGRGASQQADRRMTAVLEARTGGGISAWAADLPWAEILTADEWIDTGKADNCGCPVWTAPGDHASPKSATAHEPGCSVYTTDGGQAPIHIWTDNVPECAEDAVAALGRTFSKLNYMTYRFYGGNRTEAMSRLGISDDLLDDRGAFDRIDDASAKNVAAPRGAATDEDDPNDFGVPFGEPAPAGGGRRPPVNLTVLPDEFWDARPELRHIRQAARSKIIPPDAVLQGVLTRLAATVPGSLKVDTGILTPASLNFFAALVAPSGIGKTSSVQMAGDMLEFPVAGLDDLVALPLGSGEGLAESYMGVIAMPTGETYTSGPRLGEEKTRPTRMQVSHNSLFWLDEGESLVKLMDARSGATLGQQLRTAWSGGTLGQANGTTERTRIVRSYAMGLLVGYQPETAYSLLDGVIQGTPQRFIWARVADPLFPDEIPDWPGSLKINLSAVMADPADGDEETPATALTVCESIRASLEAIQISRVKGKIGDDEKDYNSQKQATLIKISGLLAVLAGRDSVCTEDWELAEIIWKTSSKIRDALLTARDREEIKKAEEKTKRDVEHAVAVAKNTGQLDPIIDRVARNLVRWIKKEGPQKPGYLNKKIKITDRAHIPDAVEHAIEMEWLTRNEDDVLSAGTESPK